LQNLVNQTSSAGLNAQGTSATNSSLTTTFGGQVVEVLPNGMLVIEAARRWSFRSRRRRSSCADWSAPRYLAAEPGAFHRNLQHGTAGARKGIVNDYTHRQNVLVRLLERVLVF